MAVWRYGKKEVGASGLGESERGQKCLYQSTDEEAQKREEKTRPGPRKSWLSQTLYKGFAS